MEDRATRSLGTSLRPHGNPGESFVNAAFTIEDHHHVLATGEAKTRELDVPSDTDLLELLAQGSVDAAARIYDRYASVLMAVTLRILHDRAEAEDLLHDAFVAVSERASQYSADRGSVAAWLVTLVRNLSIDRVRRQDRRGFLLRRIVAPEPVAPVPGPEELVALATVRARVRRALAQLPEVQRATLEEAFFLGLSYPEIARRQSVPLGTIKSRAARALASLRELLDDEDATQGDEIRDTVPERD